MALFTGKRGDRYYYKGQRWLGDSNAIGHRAGRKVRFAEERIRSTDGKPTGKISCVAQNAGPFVLHQQSDNSFGLVVL